ncbi:hypothetical protein [Pseudonocardia spinosispora]|uniref:hypothetical protein n=1 Tax=Pseudonocardia spinosispora TaxID=103441 RepID=UPI00040649C6|nr:hypothetical protein [Pseudonocardia spinosispora]
MSKAKHTLRPRPPMTGEGSETLDLVASAYLTHAGEPSAYNRVHAFTVGLSFNYELEVTKTRVVATVRAMLRDLIDTLPGTSPGALVDAAARAVVRRTVNTLGCVILLGPNDEPRRSPALPPMTETQVRVGRLYLRCRDQDPRAWTAWLTVLHRHIEEGHELRMHLQLLEIVAEIVARMRRELDTGTAADATAGEVRALDHVLSALHHKLRDAVVGR